MTRAVAKLGRAVPRALTDEELLRIYLNREAGSFAMRFRQVSEELRSAVGAVGSQVDQIAEGIENNVATPILALTRTTHDAVDAAESASSSADFAASSADTVSYEVEHVQRIVRELQRVVEDIQDDSTQNPAYRIMRLRRKVRWNFTVDT